MVTLSVLVKDIEETMSFDFSVKDQIKNNIHTVMANSLNVKDVRSLSRNI